MLASNLGASTSRPSDDNLHSLAASSNPANLPASMAPPPDTRRSDTSRPACCCQQDHGWLHRGGKRGKMMFVSHSPTLQHHCDTTSWQSGLYKPQPTTSIKTASRSKGATTALCGQPTTACGMFLGELHQSQAVSQCMGRRWAKTTSLKAFGLCVDPSYYVEHRDCSSLVVESSCMCSECCPWDGKCQTAGQPLPE